MHRQATAKFNLSRQRGLSVFLPGRQRKRRNPECRAAGYVMLKFRSEKKPPALPFARAPARPCLPSGSAPRPWSHGRHVPGREPGRLRAGQPAAAIDLGAVEARPELVEVPALSQLGLLVLAALLFAAGLWRLRAGAAFPI